MRITLSNYQQHIGTYTLLLNLPMKHFKYRVKGRIAFLWKFCNENNITFDIPDIWHPNKPQVNDYNIMEHFTAIPNIAEASINQVESCRLHLQVSNLSELTTPDGTHLQPELVTPPPTFTPPNKLNWPYQPRPGPAAWERWKNMLTYYFCKDNSLQLKKTIFPTLPTATPTISPGGVSD